METSTASTTSVKTSEVESLSTKDFPASEDILGPVNIDEKLLDTSELEISNMVFKKFDQHMMGNETSTKGTSAAIDNVETSLKRKSLTSTEVANALFADFEEKLAQTLTHFKVDDILEMQKNRANLRNQNDQIKNRIVNLEKQLAGTKLAHYLIKSALDPDSDNIGDYDTVDAIRSQRKKEKSKSEASQQISEDVTSKCPIVTDSPTQVVNNTVKRLIQSSIIKLPGNDGDKKPKIDAKFEESINEDSNDLFTLTDEQLSDFLDSIIKIAKEVLNADDIETPKSKQGKNVAKPTIAQSLSAKNVTPLPIDSDKKRATRRSNVKLVNPLVHHNCHLCPKGFYTAKDLHNHYVSKHSSKNESNGTFGVDVHDEQTSTKCHICGHVASSAENLLVHKSHHVRQEFCAHKCNKCQLKFCLKSELDLHRKECSLN